MSPFFFGSKAKQLYGVLHEPAEPGAEGVLLCQPGPQQAMRLNWLVRRVGALLATAGFPALRFDYFATGDSAGCSGAGTLAQWKQDVLTAAEELRDRTGINRVSVIGLRLGATLFASCPELEVSHALLWEPVVDGKAYVREMEEVQVERFERNQLGLAAPPDELVGFPLPAQERAEVLALDLRTSPHCRAARWTLIAGRSTPALQELDRALRAEGQKVALVLDPASSDPAPKSTDSLLYSTEIANALANAFRRER